MTLLLACPRAAPAEQVTARLDADRVSFSYDRRYVTLTGDARVYSQVAGDPSKFLRLQADLIEGDLSSGRFEALGNVSVVTADGSLRGASAFYNTRTSEFSLRRGALMAPVQGEGDGQVFGYAYAGEVDSDGQVIYLTDGRFTTCDRADPHYAVEVKRLRWDREQDRVVVQGGALRLYGLRIPLIPHFSYSLTGERGGAPDLLPFPSYSGRDGVRLGWAFHLTDPGRMPRARLGLTLMRRRGLRVDLRGDTEVGELTARVRASVKEDVEADVERLVTIDRLPEIGLGGSWPVGSEARLDADLSAGHYREEGGEGEPDVNEDRALLALRLTGGSPERERSGGGWWWLGGGQALYGDGQHYGHLGAGIGASATPAGWLSGSLEFSEWVTGGSTPFEFDDVDIDSELNGLLHMQLSERWGLKLGGRYDIERSCMRDYDAEVRLRDHCLTWKAGYHDAGDYISVGVEINGLLGNDRPPPHRSLEEGPPAYWHSTQEAPAHGPEDSEKGETEETADASEARLTQ